MEYCDKGDMKKFLDYQQGFKLTQLRVKKFFVETLLAVDYLHTNDIIHRDVKPSNIFLKGPEYQVQLGDLGSATKAGVGINLIEDVGTLLYQAPEVLNNSGYDHTCDIWSLGCMLFELIMHQPPFSANTEVKLIEKVKNFPPKPLAEDVSQDIKDVYQICMNKDPNSRPKSKQLLSLDIVQAWARETNLKSYQIAMAARFKEKNLLEKLLMASLMN